MSLGLLFIAKEISFHDSIMMCSYYFIGILILKYCIILHPPCNILEAHREYMDAKNLLVRVRQAVS